MIAGISSGSSSCIVMEEIVYSVGGEGGCMGGTFGNLIIIDAIVKCVHGIESTLSLIDTRVPYFD